MIEVTGRRSPDDPQKIGIVSGGRSEAERLCGFAEESKPKGVRIGSANAAPKSVHGQQHGWLPDSTSPYVAMDSHGRISHLHCHACASCDYPGERAN